MQSLCDTIRLLGCFSSLTELTDSSEIISTKEEAAFHSVFTGSVLEPRLLDFFV